MDVRYIALIVALLVVVPLSTVKAFPVVLVEDISPQPAEPGQDITLSVKFFNRGDKDSGTFSVVLDTQAPLHLKRASKDLTNINLCPSCTIENTYFLSADSSAVSGTYPVFVRSFNTGAQTQEQIDIQLRGNPSLIFSSLPTGLDNIVPGERFTVSLDLSNVGSGEARQIKIEPTSSDFVVIGGAVQTVDTLSVGVARTLRFDFVASADLDANSYTIPFTITYLDEEGTTTTTTQELGVKVVNQGQLNIQSVKIAATATGSTTLQADQPFTAVVRLENVGEGKADGITASLSCPFGEKKSFLGQLKRDEDAPAVFDFAGAKEGSYSCTVNVEYQDDQGSHTFTDKFGIEVAPAPAPFLPVIIVILIVGFLFYRRSKRHKK